MAAVQKAEEVAADVPEVVDPTMLSQDMLRKYITFAKQNCRPRLANADVEKIGQVSSGPSVTQACRVVVRQPGMHALQNCLSKTVPTGCMDSFAGNCVRCAGIHLDLQL